MIALPKPSPPLFPNMGRSFESAENNYFSNICSANPYYDQETTQTCASADFNDKLSASHDHLQLLRQLGRATPDTNINNKTMGIKKLHHNASERDRRKKMNTLYSYLRSLLPVADQMKKLSIPSTVARVVKYIPELQQEVQKLITKKEKLVSKIAHEEVRDNDLMRTKGENLTKGTNNVPSTSLPSVSLNRLGNGELVIQIPAQKSKDCPLMSELLLNLKEHGLLLLNASSFHSIGSTLLFYNFHFQVKEDCKVDCEDLNKKLISLLEKERAFSR